MSQVRPPLDADYFDQWYADMQSSGVRDRMQERHLGLPPGLLSTSLLTWDGIAEIVAALRLVPGDRLLDLACGRGGYGLEIAARTGAALVGVDFSPEAVRQAAALAEQRQVTAEYRVGDLADTGLPTASVDAVVCVDAIQFRCTPGTFAEIARVLRPGGRVALTTWEAVDRTDDEVPGRLRLVDTERGLTGAGFSDVVVTERASWRVAERALLQEAQALDPGDDPDLRSLHDEGVRVLPVFDRLRRVLAVATAPAGPPEVSRGDR